jgi:sulfoxide reductase heme-binding subunit YedZ
MNRATSSHSFFSTDLLPWTDRAGRLSWLKLVTFLLCIAPILWMAYEWKAALWSAKPLTALIRETGDWAVRFIALSLLITPLRYASRWNRLILIRRMLGLTALAYTIIHIVLYVIDREFGLLTILYDVLLRLYLILGLIATLILIALGVTSNSYWIGRLGALQWNRLHLWTYPAAALSLLHVFLVIRLNAFEASLISGLLLLFVGFRLLRQRPNPSSPLKWLALAILCGVMTALIEVIFYRISTGVDPMRVLIANLDFSYEIRPAWWVFLSGLTLGILTLIQNLSLSRKISPLA